MDIKLIIFFSTASISFMYAAQIPDDIPKCHYGDSPCMVESATKFIRHYSKGVPEIGLDPLDSIDVDDMMLINSPGHIYFYIKMTNQKVRGFENATICTISGLDRDPDQHKIEIELNVPRLLMEGSFSLHGRGLIVFTNSTGLIKSDLQNVRLKLTVKVFVEHRRYKRYLRIYDVASSIDIDRWIMMADNIYKDNSDLTFLVNRAVNENWAEFWHEVEPNVLPAFSKAIKQRIQKLVQSISYDDWFLKD